MTLILSKICWQETTEFSHRSVGREPVWVEIDFISTANKWNIVSDDNIIGQWARTQRIFTEHVTGDDIVSAHVLGLTDGHTTDKSTQTVPTVNTIIVWESRIFLIHGYTILIYVYNTCGVSTGTGADIVSAHVVEFAESQNRQQHTKYHQSTQYVKTSNLCLQDLNLCLQHVWDHYIRVIASCSWVSVSSQRPQNRSNHPEWHQPANCILLHKHLELMFTRSEFMFTACVGPLGVMGIACRHANEFTESTEPPTAPKMPSSSKFHIQYVEIPNLCLHDLNLCLQHAWGHHGWWYHVQACHWAHRHPRNRRQRPECRQAAKLILCQNLEFMFT